MNFKSLIIMLLGLSPMIASAQTEMTVNPATDVTEKWGTARAERYDVAFRLSDPSLIGTNITHVSIPFDTDEAITDHSIWLASELKLQGDENDPDILQISVEPESGFISVALPEPINVSEKGCYIGFSFTVKELNDYSKAPVTVSPAGQPGNMYIHTSRRYLKWGTQDLSLTPEIAITLSGDFHNDALAVITVPETGNLRNEETLATTILRNHGLSEVKSFDYEVEINGTTTARHIEFENPLPTHYFADIPFPLELDSDLDAGSYPISFTITQVNGMPNESSANNFATYFFIYPYLPERIPLMEEYTGTWCGWCPRGIVGMDKMTELYPDKFVYAAYHRDKDPMTTVEDIVTPHPYQGAPSGYLDRKVGVDPYNGLSTETVATADEGIGAVWKKECEAVTTGTIKITAVWSDESHKTIVVNSQSLFVRDYYIPRFRIGYLLTANGLKGEGNDWIQHNYYSGLDEYAPTELNEFVEQPRAIADISYDGVVVMCSPLEGVEGSLPAEISMATPVNHSYSFIPAEAVNYLGESLPLNMDQLNVIAYITDSVTGEIVNCARCAVTDDADVESILLEKPAILINDGNICISINSGAVTAALYNASGLLLDTVCSQEDITIAVPPTHGIYILIVNGISYKIIL